MGSHKWRDGPKFQDATFPGFFRENLVPGKWHSAMQTLNLFLVFSAILGFLESLLESLPLHLRKVLFFALSQRIPVDNHDCSSNIILPNTWFLKTMKYFVLLYRFINNIGIYFQGIITTFIKQDKLYAIIRLL